MNSMKDIDVAKKMINLQQSATSRNIEFDLSFDTVKQLMTRTHCYFTSVKFEQEGKYSISVDRVDSDKGYIEGNVVACTVDINSKKANLTFIEIQQLYNKITQFMDKQPKSKSESKRKKIINNDEKNIENDETE